jgi:hypothetical protein
MLCLNKGFLTLKSVEIIRLSIYVTRQVKYSCEEHVPEQYWLADIADILILIF